MLCHMNDFMLKKICSNAVFIAIPQFCISFLYRILSQIYTSLLVFPVPMRMKRMVGGQEMGRGTISEPPPASGKVYVKHLSSGDDLRKGRYLSQGFPGMDGFGGGGKTCRTMGLSTGM